MPDLIGLDPESTQAVPSGIASAQRWVRPPSILDVGFDQLGEQRSSCGRSGRRAVWQLPDRVRCLDIAEDSVLSACVSEAGLSWHAFEAARAEGTPAELLRRNVDDSIQRGMFGSPFFIVDGEPFFGLEKLPVVEEWLATGGW